MPEVQSDTRLRRDGSRRGRHIRSIPKTDQGNHHNVHYKKVYNSDQRAAGMGVVITIRVEGTARVTLASEVEDAGDLAEPYRTPVHQGSNRRLPHFPRMRSTL